MNEPQLLVAVVLTTRKLVLSIPSFWKTVESMLLQEKGVAVIADRNNTVSGLFQRTVTGPEPKYTIFVTKISLPFEHLEICIIVRGDIVMIFLIVFSEAILASNVFTQGLLFLSFNRSVPMVWRHKSTKNAWACGSKSTAVRAELVVLTVVTTCCGSAVVWIKCSGLIINMQLTKNLFHFLTPSLGPIMSRSLALISFGFSFSHGFLLLASVFSVDCLASARVFLFSCLFIFLASSWSVVVK